MTDQPENFDLRSLDIAAEKKEELLRLFPEVRTEDGLIDFERLKLALGEMVDAGRERYGMNWPGKADCFRAIQTPSLGTLLPCPEESVNFDSSENLIIEGENMEVLKLLQKAYLGKVKMIYIDPPYNTGNDFIYPDNYSESLRTYLEYTGQADARGRKFGTNSDTSGRFHSRWMNMMYPRLYLARNLLSDSGILMVSIDDNEVENLRRLCDEIFGEESYFLTLVWQRRQMPDSRNQDRASQDHEYVICYKMPSLRLKGIPVDKSKYSNPDGDIRGPWFSADLTGLANKEERPNLHYDLIDPVTNKVYPASPTRGWSCSRPTMARLIEENRIIWPAKPDGRPRLKKFLYETTREQTGFSSWLETGFTTDGTRTIQEIFGEKVFSFSKPVNLLKVLIEQGTENSNGIILDFFSGSGTIAQAVLEANQQDNGNRKFILVQLPEPTGRDDYPTIADITKERVRRVIQKITQQMAEEKEAEKKKPPELFALAPSAPPREPDLGFRVFKLAETNFKPWDAGAARDAAALEKQLELHVDHLREGRTKEDILFEILLKSGFPLTTPIEILQVTQTCEAYRVADGALLICLEKKLTLEAIRAMAGLKPERIVLLDAEFAGNDQLKANAVHIFKDAGISSFKTI